MILYYIVEKYIKFNIAHKNGYTAFGAIENAKTSYKKANIYLKIKDTKIVFRKIQKKAL